MAVSGHSGTGIFLHGLIRFRFIRNAQRVADSNAVYPAADHFLIQHVRPLSPVLLPVIIPVRLMSLMIVSENQSASSSA